MEHNFSLISGCQRSGTTLLYLVLDSHPEVTGIDEAEFEFDLINVYMNSPWLTRHVSFKLPRYAPILEFMHILKELKILWCVRNPLDVVNSMVTLRVDCGPDINIVWAQHPGGARREIGNCWWALSAERQQRLRVFFDEYTRIAQKDPLTFSRRDIVFGAALCWRIKSEIGLEYSASDPAVLVVRYESLVSDPESTIRTILDHLHLPWNDNVLRHHELHDGIYTGNTDGHKPISSDEIGKGLKHLAADEVELVRRVCGDVAESWGYAI